MVWGKYIKSMEHLNTLINDSKSIQVHKCLSSPGLAWSMLIASD